MGFIFAFDYGLISFLVFCFQIVKILYRNFSEKKAVAYLYKLEKETTQLIAICKQILELSQQMEQKLR